MDNNQNNNENYDDYSSYQNYSDDSLYANSQGNGVYNSDSGIFGGATDPNKNKAVKSMVMGILSLVFMLIAFIILFGAMGDCTNSISDVPENNSQLSGMLGALSWKMGISTVLFITSVVLSIIAIVMGVKYKKGVSKTSTSENTKKATTGLATGIIAVIISGIMLFVTSCTGCTTCISKIALDETSEVASAYSSTEG